MSHIASASDQGDLRPSLVVLVVEDEVSVRLITADYLREVGYSVVEAANAHEALAVFGSQVPIDLVFTDVNMPGVMDGESLANWLSTHRPEIPVIVTSGAIRLSLDGNSRNRRFIAKPYSLMDVEKQISELMQRP
jgi:two-component system, response regulator PdtaR